MAIFRGFAIYLALAGVIAVVLLIQKLSAPPPLATPVAEPAVNPYENAIAACGIVEAMDRNIAIGAPQSGLIIGVFARIGDLVIEGQPLFQIDDRELQALLLFQKAQMSVAEATLDRLKDQLSRLESIEDMRAISQDELKTRRKDVMVAEAQLMATQSQAKQTKILIRRLTVCAPIAGTILQNNIRVGEFFSAAANIPAMLLGNLDHLQVRVDIDEQNASHFVPHVPAVAFPKNCTTIAIPLRFDCIEPYIIPKRSLTGSSEERVDTRVLQVLYLFDPPKDFPIYVGQQVDVFIERKNVEKQQPKENQQLAEQEPLKEELQPSKEEEQPSTENQQAIENPH